MFNPATLKYSPAEQQQVIAHLSADEATPIAYSRARLFRAPQYMLAAELRYSRKIGDYVLYTISARTSSKGYNLDTPVYESTCYEDIADVWALFA